MVNLQLINLDLIAVFVLFVFLQFYKQWNSLLTVYLAVLYRKDATDVYERLLDKG